MEDLTNVPLKELQERKAETKKNIATNATRSVKKQSTLKRESPRNIKAPDSKVLPKKQYFSTSPPENDGDNLSDIIVLSLLETAEYYKINKEQAKRIFNWSLVMMVAGFAALWTGLLFFYFGNSPNLTLAILVSTPAILLEIIGGLFFAMHNKILKQYNELHQKLSVVQDTMLSLDVIKNIQDPEAKTEAEIYLVKELMGRQK